MPEYVHVDPLPALHLPYRTAHLPGIGGRIRAQDDDFAVDEVPAYAPAGEGDHVFVHVEKRGLTTLAAAQAIARAAGVPVRDVGWAGLKDRHAVTRQWLSLPPPVKPEAIAGFTAPGLTVLAAVRHRHKLRTGHLHGNRFAIVIRGVGDAAVAADRARAVLSVLATVPGSPNWYGEQRFGMRGDNATAGLAILRARGKGGGAPRQKRLLVSAFQSYLFNQWLAERMTDGLDATVLAGDVLQKRASGGMFTSTDPETDQARLAAGELGITGPMFGAAMRAPPDGTPAQLREARILDALGLGPADFAPLGALATGTRRAAAVVIGDPEVETVGADAVRVTCSLPAGAYATAVLRELQKTPDDKATDSPPVGVERGSGGVDPEEEDE